MKKYIVVILPLLLIDSLAGTYKARSISAQDRSHSRVIKAKDRPSSSRSHGNKRSSNPLISTVEASSEMSFQITSAISLEVSSEITTYGGVAPERRSDTAELKFLNDNRLKITEDISQGQGEHITTLLSLMKIEQSNTTLSNIQSNFEELFRLEDNAFLSKIREISNS